LLTSTAYAAAAMLKRPAILASRTAAEGQTCTLLILAAAVAR
jgi:hypothetical protein